jgi:hypothetical protein
VQPASTHHPAPHAWFSRRLCGGIHLHNSPWIQDPPTVQLSGIIRSESVQSTPKVISFCPFRGSPPRRGHGPLPPGIQLLRPGVLVARTTSINFDEEIFNKTDNIFLVEKQDVILCRLNIHVVSTRRADKVHVNERAGDSLLVAQGLSRVEVRRIPANDLLPRVSETGYRPRVD